jgi:KipI family sensor histidine kinase inhibitor
LPKHRQLLTRGGRKLHAATHKLQSDPPTWRWLPFGEAALLLEASPATPLSNCLALALAAQLMAAPPPGLIAAVPAISSLLVTFDPLALSLDQLRALLAPQLEQLAPTPPQPARVVSLPVRYGGAEGPDLEDVALTLGLSPREVVALHCGQVYRVMMIGFAPGFPYLGPLPDALHLPRRATPRSAVPPGSVAIAAGLTGVYPTRLPGGWHLIGRTETAMFEPQVEPPALLSAGDGVRFVAASVGVQPL